MTLASFPAVFGAAAMWPALVRETAKSVLALSLFAVLQPPALAETFRIHGSTTFNRILLEPFSASIEEASGHRLIVVPNKSLNGVIDLLERRAELAMISSTLSAELKALSIARPGLDGAHLVAHHIAETRVAFAVHPRNKVRQVSREDMVRILSGQIKDWSELGGVPAGIKTTYVRSAGGVTSAVIDILMSGQPLKPAYPIPVESPMQVVKIVAQDPSALGLAQLRLVRDMRLVELTTGAPVVQTLFLVTAGPPNLEMVGLIKAVQDVAERKLTMAE